MDLPIVLSHKTAWLYHNVARSPSHSREQAAYTMRIRLLTRRSRPRACPNWDSMPRG